MRPNIYPLPDAAHTSDATQERDHIYLPHHFYQQTGMFCKEAWENPAWNGVTYANMSGRMLDQLGGKDSEL